MPSNQIDSRRKASFEHDTAQRDEVSDADIHFSRMSGIAPVDVDAFCRFTRNESLLIIVRCPKRPARYFHGKFDPKPKEVGANTDPETGLVTHKGVTYVSDYDLMCVWRFVGATEYEHLYFTEIDPNVKNVFRPEVQVLWDKLNELLASRLQHGAQDDYRPNDRQHPNVKPETIRQPGKPDILMDRFMVFNVGNPSYVYGAEKLKLVYEQLLPPNAWQYDAAGVHSSHPQYQKP